MDESLFNGRRTDAVYASLSTKQNLISLGDKITKRLYSGIPNQSKSTVTVPIIGEEVILSRVVVIYNQFREDSAYMAMTPSERVSVITAAIVSSIVEDLSVVLAERVQKVRLQAALLQGSLEDPAMDNLKGSRTINMMDNM